VRAHPHPEPNVQAIGRRPQRAPDGAPLHYERHRPEQTTLYRLMQQLAATFHRANRGQHQQWTTKVH